MSIALVLFSVTSAWPDLRVIGRVGYYSPNFGEFNEATANMNASFGTDLEFKGGIVYGIGLSYDISSRFETRVEYNSSTSKTEDTSSITWEGTTSRMDISVDYGLTTTPIVISAVLRFFPDMPFRPYVGLGVGIFSSRFSGAVTQKYYEDGTLTGTVSGSGSYEDSPAGFQIIGGIENDVSANLVLASEIKYVLAEATFNIEDAIPPYSIKCDWSGFMGSAGIEYRF